MNAAGEMSPGPSLLVFTASAFVIVAVAVWAIYPEGGFTIVIFAGLAASASFAAIIALWWAVLRMRDRR